MVPRVAHRLLLSFSLFIAAAPGIAQTVPAEEQFTPYVGLPGKDVIWLPAELVMVNHMLDIAKVTPQDTVMDLGSGDGRTVIAAAKRGARGIGVEFNPSLVEYSTRLAAKEGVSERVTFLMEDLFQTDLTRASVITLFLLPTINMKLRPKLLDLKPGTRIVSNTFTMEEWKDDASIREDSSSGCGLYCVAHLWIIPAKVSGTWKSTQGEVSFQQQFQMVSGTVNAGEVNASVEGRLRGDSISFTAGGAEYTGRVNGNTIEGTVKSAGNTAGWTATRVGN